MRVPGTFGLLARHGRAAVGPSIALAILALLAGGIAASAPRLLDVVAAAELRTDIAAVAPVDRDITLTQPVPYLGGPHTGVDPDHADTVLDPNAFAFAKIAKAADPPLLARLGAADWYVRSDQEIPAPSDDRSKDGWIYSVAYQTDPAIADRIAYTAGRAPKPTTDGTLEIGLSTQTAEEMRWDLGETRAALPGAGGADSDGTALTLDGPGSPVTLVGTFDGVDPDADYWGHSPGVLVPRIFDDGNKPKQVHAIAIVDPAEMDSGTLSLEFSVTGWYPLDLDGIDPDSANALLPSIRKFVAAHPGFGDSAFTIPGEDDTARFATGLTGALPAAASRSTALRAILYVVGAGPFGAMIAVFELAVRSILARRRPTIALATARGASAAQVRGALALEGAVAGFLPAVVGVVAAVLLVPGALAPLDLIPAAVLALVPIAFLAFGPGARGLRETRVDGASRRTAAVRIVIEIIVCLLAAGSAAMLLLHGVGDSDAAGIATTGGFDPFVVAAPLLVALAVCVIVLRILPPVLAGIHAGARGSKGLVGFAGSARAVRERGLGVGAALAVVIAVGIAVFGVTLSGTVRTATTDAARLAAGGGSVLLTSAWFSDGQIEAVEAVDGVTAAAAIEDLGQTAFDGWHGGRIDLIAGQWDTLAAIRGDLPADAAADGAIPAVVSAQTAATLAETGAALTLDGKPVDIVATLPADPGWRLESPDWVFVDTAAVPWPSGQTFTPAVLVVQTKPGAAVATGDLVSASGAAYAQSAEEALDGLDASPSVAAIGELLGAAAALSGLLALVAIVLAGQLSASGSRRVYGALRTLGATRAQILGLAFWSIAPSVVAALVAGAGLGIALPYLVVAGVDLAPFTGGTVITAPTTNPIAVAAIALVLAFDAVVISMIAAAFTVRRSPAATVSIGGD